MAIYGWRLGAGAEETKFCVCNTDLANLAVLWSKLADLGTLAIAFSGLSGLIANFFQRTKTLAFSILLIYI